MAIYLICYTLMAILYFNLDRRPVTRNTWVRLWAGIVLLSLLAAFRANSIGTDLGAYPLQAYRWGRSVRGIEGLVGYFAGQRFEKGYLLLMLLCGKLCWNFNVALFVVGLITNGCTIMGLWRVREHVAFNIVVLIYCFLFYQSSFNEMRQWLALAVITWGVKFLYEQDWKRYLLTILVAMTFHISAILGLALYPMMVMLRGNNSRFNQCAIVVGAVAALLLFQPLAAFLVNRGILSAHYEQYTTGHRVGISWTQSLIRVPPILLSMVYYRRMKERDQYHEFWFIVMIVDLILAQVQSIQPMMQRLANYFTTSRYYELSLACKVGDRKSRMLIKSLVMAYVIMYWWVCYIYLGYHDTYPYVSTILGIGV